MIREKYIFFIFTIALLLPFNTFAQENKKELGVSIGGNFGYFKDDLFSALNYNKAGGSGEIFYTVGYTKRKTILDVKIGFEQGKLKYPGIRDYSTDYWNGSIQVDFMKQLFEKQGHSLYVGGRYRSFGQAAILLENITAYTYLVNHGLNFNAMYNFSHGKHNLSSMVSVSLLGYTTHTPDNWYDNYTAEDMPSLTTYLFDGDFTLPNEFMRAFIRKKSTAYSAECNSVSSSPSIIGARRINSALAKSFLSGSP